jgi:2-keto-4-pentenoate hydratase/2-oxohepta-3-ene-1,7-dioic acid hydratase in catechol pathway
MSAPDTWLCFETAAGPRYGYLSGESIVPIDGDLFGDWQRAGDPVPLAGTRLLAPVVPPTFYACGINYEAHWRTAAEEFGLDLQKTWPRSPEIGYRAQSAIVGPGEAIVLPADVPPNVQAESELGVVIGKRARHVSVAQAPDCIFGYTICNDVSARGWQFQDRTFWRSKNSDTFKPLGPWIRRGVDPANLVTRVRVNGELRETFRTGNMIYSVAEYIAAMSRYITLVPGDLIIMGSDGRCPQIHAGDTVSIEIDGIGTLTNPVIRGDLP